MNKNQIEEVMSLIEKRGADSFLISGGFSVPYKAAWEKDIEADLLFIREDGYTIASKANREKDCQELYPWILKYDKRTNMVYEYDRQNKCYTHVGQWNSASQSITKEAKPLPSAAS